MIAQGSVIQGQGQVIRKDGTVIDITLTSDPLTQEQADELNQQQEKDHGSNAR